MTRRRKFKRRLTGLVVGLLALTACTTQRPDGTVRRHYLGYAVVTVPRTVPAAPRITVREIQSYGLAFGDGSTVLGVGKERLVALPPDGRIYLVVETDEQLQRARQLIEQHPDLGICVTQNLNR